MIKFTSNSVSCLPSDWQDHLRIGAAQLQLTLTAEVLAKFAFYTELLLKWNKSYNLTAIDTPIGVLHYHLLDSLAVVPYVVGPHVLDVGSGAGLPGIPFALVLPDIKLVLVDSNNKKARFLRHVILALSLPNVEVVQERVEKFHFVPCFDTIVTRAVGEMRDILQQTLHLCSRQGQWLFMKGKYPTQELQELQRLAPIKSVAVVHELHIPGVDAQRHVIKVHMR